MKKTTACKTVKNKALTLALACTLLSSTSLATGVGLQCKKDHDINRKKNVAMVLAFVIGGALLIPTLNTWKQYKEISR